MLALTDSEISLCSVDIERPCPRHGQLL